MNLLITGGGTAGHVMPNVVLINELQQKTPDLKITYVGTKAGLEFDLINQNCKNVEFKSIVAAKFRRYFSWQNVADFLRFPFAIAQALRIISQTRPALVFSKGGYVSLPVVIAAWVQKIPIIIHESDSSPGLTTKITCRLATEVWYANKYAHGALKSLTKAALHLRPTLVRKNLFNGNSVRAKAFLGFERNLPTILIMGGSLGAEAINTVIDQAKDDLSEKYNLIHICGKGKLRPSTDGYATQEYVTDELPDFYALADIIIGRSGATSLAEWEYLKKPCVLIPLPTDSSRGEQLTNAKTFLEKNQGLIIEQKDLNPKTLIAAINDITATAKPATNNNALEVWQKNKNRYLESILSYF